MFDQFVSQLRLRASPPEVPPGMVRRSRLERRLSDGNAIVLLSAGPGFGKTLAVASWLDRVAGPAAWLTVDDSDNDLRTFWSDVLAALSVGEVLPEASPLREIVPATGFGALEALQIRTGLAESGRPVVLVLDEIHHLRNAEVLESLGNLMEYRPPHLRLVLISRADPLVRLHRLRVAGALTEVRSQDLAFTKDEAAELFVADDIELTDEQLRVLLDRTQGWPVGLRLAAMFLAGTGVTGGITRFTGTERSVAEYLIGEVLDRLPEADRDFLLKTSVIERINASLATVLTGRPDSQRALEELVAANAFVVRQGEDSGWFRYHPLLRDLLAHRLLLEQPGTGEELHARAAQWFATHGQPIQAIRHATVAGDRQEAGRLLTASVLPLILTPDGPALAAALEPLARRAEQDPDLSTLLSAAIWHFQRHDFGEMHRDASEAAEFLPGTPEPIRVPAEILIAATTVTHDRVRASARLVGSSARMLDLLDRAPRQLVPAARHYRVIGLNNLGVGHLLAGDLTAAAASLTAAETQADEHGIGLAALTARTNLAILDVIHGRLGRAEIRTSRAQRVADRRGWLAEPQALALYVAAGMTLLARNRLDEAADTISAGLAASSKGSDTGSRLMLGIAAVGVAIAQRDAGAARSAADRLAAELAEVPDPPDLLRRWGTVAQAQMLLASGDPAGAVDLLRPGPDAGFAAALERVTLAKAHLALRHPDRLRDLLAPLTEPGTHYLGPRVEARILLALAADQDHHDGAALESITEAIDLAEPEGMIQPFLDAGPVALGMITRHRHIVARHLDFTRRLLAQPSAGGTDVDAHSSAMVVRLTERELIVLRYLPTMLKAGEIGKDLYLSVNTVKSHMRSIYRKLDATNRRAAVERARDLALL